MPEYRHYGPVLRSDQMMHTDCVPEHDVGVFDARMVRIYRRIGSSPDVLGSQGKGREQISVGLWEFTPEGQAQVSKSAGITPEMSKRWFALSFGQIVQPKELVAA